LAWKVGEDVKSLDFAIDKLRQEYYSLEQYLIRRSNGNDLKKKKGSKEIDREANIKRLVDEYTHDDMDDFINGIANNMGEPSGVSLL